MRNKFRHANQTTDQSINVIFQLDAIFCLFIIVVTARHTSRPVDDEHCFYFYEII